MYGYKKNKYFLVVILLLFSVAASADWTYELNDDAKFRYLNKEKYYKCDAADTLLKEKKYGLLYLTIRDAALLSSTECDEFIQRNRRQLVNEREIKVAIYYYFHKRGDNTSLKALADMYDNEILKESGVHSVGDIVEVFGFLGDWEVSGKRLVKYADLARGGNSELLCSAVRWRRFLHGEVSFEENWMKIGKEEKVKESRLERKLYSCFPWEREK